MKLTVKFLLASALLCTSMAGARADQGVMVVAKDGSTTSLTLPEVKRIDIGAEAVTLHSAQGSTTVPLSELDHIKIGTEVSSVQTLLKEGEIAVWPTRVTDYVNVTGLAPESTVTIYSVSGALAASATASDGTARLDLSGAAAGIYIVNTGDRSVKIIKD